MKITGEGVSLDVEVKRRGIGGVLHYVAEGDWGKIEIRADAKSPKKKKAAKKKAAPAKPKEDEPTLGLDE